MLNSKDESYIFLGVGVGSCVVSGSSGLTFRSSVFNNPLTILKTATDSEQSMTGESRYAYSENVNEGSFGISGSYGFSAVTKVTAGLSAYVGNSKATDTKNISLYYTTRVISGYEYIPFNDLTPPDLLNSLQLSAKKQLGDMLENLSFIMEKVGNNDLVQMMAHGNVPGELVERINRFVKSVDKFKADFGDGVVVAVVWGSIGEVIMELSEERSANTWKYGGKTNFSYSGIQGSMAIDMAYNGKKASKDSKVQVNVRSNYKGAAIQSDVNEWFKKFAGKGFEELAGLSPLESAPLTASASIPPIPEFQKPPKDDSLVNKMGSINNLENLKAFAVASAFDKAKEKNPSLELQQFLEDSQKKVDTKPLENIAQQAKTNDVKVVKEKQDRSVTAENTANAQGVSATQDTENRASLTELYIPLGVWICGWEEIFPWLNTGIFNGLDGLDGVEDSIRTECMTQDLLALARMYRSFAATGISHEQFFENMVDFNQLANVFDGAIYELRINKISTEEVYNRLTPIAKILYDHWDKNKILRDAELGLGIWYNGNSMPITEKEVESVPLVPLNDTYKEYIYPMGRVDFNPESPDRNYRGFAESYKLLPLLLPDGKIMAFGPSDGLLKKVEKDVFIFNQRARTAAQFVVNPKNQTLVSDDGIVLYPIPVTAAQGIEDWKGQSFSRNLGTMKTLNDKLKAMVDGYSKAPLYAFDRRAPENLTAPYTMSRMRAQYMGLVKKPFSDFEPIP